MQIIKLNNQPIVDTPHKVAVRKLYSFAHADFIHITLKPGESLKTHITPVDAFFYGLTGVGMVEIGEEIQKVQENELVFSPHHVKHRLFNNGDEDFSFLVVKTPSPQGQKTQIL